jgi:hypothetical protein
MNLENWYWYFTDNIDFIDKASYSGNVVLEKFNLGKFLDRKDLGEISMDMI